MKLINFRNATIFLTLIFLTAITGNIVAQEQTDAPIYFINFQLLPGMNLFGIPFRRTTDIFLIAPTVGIGYNLRGLGTASVGLINTGRVQGVQLSGVFNFANAGLDGLQTASIFNVAKGTVRGIQIAGINNNASGTFFGIQAAGLINNFKGDMWGIQLGAINIRGEGGGVGVQVGLINISESGNVIPIGVVNKVKDGMEHFLVYTDDMLFMNAGFRSGTKIFYTHSGIGFGGGLIPGREGDKLIINRGGFGFEIPLRKFFIDIDISTGNIFKVDEVTDFWQFFFGTNTTLYQLRLIGGFKLFERLGVFAGISYDYLNQSKNTDPSPGDFAGAVPGKSFDNQTHKIGIFGGMQF
ncbi:hypothetical protein R84B8_01676 [Treponema sp. R8-4-B8]